MTYRLRLSLAACLLLATASPLRGQDDRLASCVARYGAGDPAAFVRFDRELRAALSADDPSLLTLVARYPLRVNAGGGTTTVENARTLAARAREIFPPAVRSAALATTPGDLICKDEGIGYGRGSLWVTVSDSQPLRFGIGVVNLGGGDSVAPPGAVFVCRTAAARWLVGHMGEGRAQLRGWVAGRSVADAADVTATGTEALVGTGPCGHREWTFSRAGTTWSLSEPGCTQDTPPAGAVGVIVVTTAGKPTQAWCY